MAAARLVARAGGSPA